MLRASAQRPAKFRCIRRVFSATCAKTNYRTEIDKKNSVVNAFVHVSPPEEPMRSGPLSGQAIGIKDNICTVSMPTTCSSKMLQEFTSPFDATVVSLLRDAGADLVGKTNCDEFGMGSLNIHSIHGPVVNPYNVPIGERSLPRSAGGSSGGSAAAVAAGICHAALGTDTGGSVRLPASYCGVVGLKPSYGLLSRWGVVSFADSLDCVGILSPKVSDARAVFDVLNIYDEKDPTARSDESRQRSSHYTQARLHELARTSPSAFVRRLRVGIPQEYFPFELSPAISRLTRRVIGALRRLGAMIVPVSLPSTSYALSAYYVIASAEASSNLARYDGIEYGYHARPTSDSDLSATSMPRAQTRSQAFGSEVRKRVLLGTYALTADAFDNYFLQAQRVRQLIKDDFNNVFRLPDFSTGLNQELNLKGVDVLLHPSAIRTAPPLRERPGLETYVQDVLTVPASLAGLPALSVPVPPALRRSAFDDDDSWPVGVSVVGQWGCDEMVLRLGEVIEELTEY